MTTFILWEVMIWFNIETLWVWGVFLLSSQSVGFFVMPLLTTSKHNMCVWDGNGNPYNPSKKSRGNKKDTKQKSINKKNKKQKHSQVNLWKDFPVFSFNGGKSMAPPRCLGDQHSIRPPKGAEHQRRAVRSALEPWYVGEMGACRSWVLYIYGCFQK